MKIRSILIGLFLLTYGTVGYTQYSLTLFGLKSGSTDIAEFSRKVSKVLREVARKVNEFELTDIVAELDELMILSGCNTLDENCMKEIAKDVESDFIIFGGIEKVGNNYVMVNLFMFDKGNNKLLSKEIHDKLPLNISNNELYTKCEEFLKKLSPVIEKGTVLIYCNVGEADVILDGHMVGITMVGKPLVLLNLNPGKHIIEVTKEGYEKKEFEIKVEGGKETTLKVELPKVQEEKALKKSLMKKPQEERESSLYPIQEKGVSKAQIYKWVMIGSLGVTVAMLTLGIIGGVKLYQMGGTPFGTGEGNYEDDIENGINEALLKKGVPQDLCVVEEDYIATDVNKEYYVSKFREYCDKAHTYEILQWVGYGVAGAFAALSGLFLYLYLRAESQATTKDTDKLSFSSQISYGYAGISFNYEF